MIISLTAQKQNGKTTVAEYLCENYGFEALSHAKPLKDACAILFDIEDLYSDAAKNQTIQIGNKFSYRKIEEASRIICGEPMPNVFMGEIIPFFKNRKMKVREILQEMGTDICRNIFGEDVWLKNLNRRIELAESPVVVDDCRFLNESINLRALGAYMVGIQRPPINLEDLHQSEIEMIENWDTMVDTTIVNSGSLEDLYAMVEKIVEEVLE